MILRKNGALYRLLEMNYSDASYHGVVIYSRQQTTKRYVINGILLVSIEMIVCMLSTWKAKMCFEV